MKDFEKYIEYLKEDLLESKNKGLSENIIQAKYNHLSRIYEYYTSTESYIKDLELDYYLDTELLKQQCAMMEAILLIHGINDFSAYMSKGIDYLRSMAMEMNAKGVIQIPAKVQDILSDDRKHELFNILKNAERSN
jgi:hypothetical protein